jgi:hypothetical protein
MAAQKYGKKGAKIAERLREKSMEKTALKKA